MSLVLPALPDTKQKAVRAKVVREYAAEISALRQRDDYLPEYEYFLEMLLLQAEPERFRDRFPGPLAVMNCLQAPPEIFDALGMIPYRFCANPLSGNELSASRLPALSCPVIRSCLGAFLLDDSIESKADMVVIAGTCDWMTRLPEMIAGRHRAVHFLELPHMKESERGCSRWQEEILLLKAALEKQTGCRMTRKALRASIERYASARMALRSLMESRSRREIATVWCMVMTNAFCMGDVDAWTNQVNQVVTKQAGCQICTGGRIFLAGSPVMFPNLKIPRLIEDAGLHVAADELCSSERTLAGLPVCEDDSEFAMMQALAGQSHQGCSCPTYADNSRRLDNIMATMRQRNISGLVLHILKGCHPYDIGSYEMEQTLRGHGFHFLRIETDHSREDSKSLLLRLEAFSEILGD